MRGHVLDDVRELRVLLRGVALKAEGFLSRRFLLLLLDGAHVVLRNEILSNRNRYFVPKQLLYKKCVLHLLYNETEKGRESELFPF